jgi:hypothetical protein
MSFPFGKLACPECGSDMETGWREDADDSYWTADVPDAFTDEDYRKVVSELPGATPLDWTPRRTFLVAIGLLMVLSLLPLAC